MQTRAFLQEPEKEQKKNLSFYFSNKVKPVKYICTLIEFKQYTLHGLLRTIEETKQYGAITAYAESIVIPPQNNPIQYVIRPLFFTGLPGFSLVHFQQTFLGKRERIGDYLPPRQGSPN